jgi:hypothetical protein
MTYLYILVAIVLRILPHPWNMTPVGAMFLFSGATFKSRRLSLVVPLLALLVSDYLVVKLLYHGVYSWIMTSPWPGFLVVAMIGWWLGKSITWPRVLGASLVSSCAFFVVSNFTLWLTGELYPITLSGLTTCFVEAVPFFHNTVLGDLAYSALFFGSYEFVRRRKQSLAPSRTK